MNAPAPTKKPLCTFGARPAHEEGFHKAIAEAAATMRRYAGCAAMTTTDPDACPMDRADALIRARHYNRAADIVSSIPYRED